MITHKPLKVVMQGKLPHGVRNEDGFICFMWKPHRYPNQKARYAEETQQVIEQAALIAAAPDLLAACKRFPNEHEHADDCDCRWCEVKQAIAAAELTS